jgi:hypothetical protein
VTMVAGGSSPAVTLQVTGRASSSLTTTGLRPASPQFDQLQQQPLHLGHLNPQVSFITFVRLSSGYGIFLRCSRYSFLAVDSCVMRDC